MRIISLEASTDRASCALWQDGRWLESYCASDRPSSETLLPAIGQLLADAGLGLSQLDGIAFGAGPGSFTGVRVACSVAQGLGFVHDLPLFPVSTLAAVAFAAGSGALCALLDARMKEVYCGCYRVSDQGIEPLSDEVVASPDLLPLPVGPAWRVAGNAPAAYPILAERLARAGLPVVSEAAPGAVAVAKIGVWMMAAGEGIPAELAVPRYVRNKVAQTIAERLASGGKA